VEKILDLRIIDLRKSLENNDEIQGQVLDLLVKGRYNINRADKLEVMRACYGMVYVFWARNNFPLSMKEKIERFMKLKKLERTFLKQNFIQRAKTYWNEPDEVGNRKNILFGDYAVNESDRGSQAIKNGRATSPQMLKFIKKDIVGYSVNELFEELYILIENSTVLSSIEKKRKQLELEIVYGLIEERQSDYEEMLRCRDEFKQEEGIRVSDQYSAGEKETLILARRGQGKFREGVLRNDKCCPFTRIYDEKLLVASHIKPWKESSMQEKIDPNNGIILTPTYDKLFDRGYISFNDDGTLLVSSKISKKVQKILGLVAGEKIDGLKLPEAKKVFLEYHRKHIFGE
jgi:Predicted restriction endonuclease